MKRIVLTGAECTGKSTLAQALSCHYGEPWTTEFVRGYVDQLDRELIQADLEEIFCGQIAAEDAGWARAARDGLLGWLARLLNVVDHHRPQLPHAAGPPFGAKF